MEFRSIRYIKTAMVASIAFFFTLAAFNNVIAFSNNYTALQHVLSMDTTFQAPELMQRAITHPAIQLAAYYLIVFWESMTALLCWIGVIQLLRAINKNSATFLKAKNMAFIGLFAGFLLYMVGFMVIAGEWFCMWQSPTWNAQPTAGLFVTLIMLVMLFLASSQE